MNYYKLLGASSIICASLIFYFYHQKNEKNKIDQLSAYIDLLEYVKQQIQHYKSPINVIFSDCDHSYLAKCSYLSKTPPVSFTDLLNNSILYLDSESIDLLYKFAQGFGALYYDEQIEFCNKYINELKSKREAYKENIARNKKICLALCLCFSVSIILLLI